VKIHQGSSNKSNRAREFHVVAMDGNPIPFTQFRAFASDGVIDNSTGVPIVPAVFPAAHKLSRENHIFVRHLQEIVANGSLAKPAAAR